MHGLFFPAFIAGLLTFLAPCTLPLIPGYLGLVSGLGTFEELKGESSAHLRLNILVNAVFFVMGFSLVFILLGMFSVQLGSAVAAIKPAINRIAGLVLIVVSAYFFKKGSFPLSSSKYMAIPRRLADKIPFRPYLTFLGIAFALSWTPCVGPILGTVLYLASSGKNVGEGALLLAIFSLGLAIPFLLTAILAGYVMEKMGVMQKYARLTALVTGILFLVLGMYLLLNQLPDFVAMGNRLVPARLVSWLNGFY
jgi:cytochrome c-type biogenesis protein